MWINWSYEAMSRKFILLKGRIVLLLSSLVPDDEGKKIKKIHKIQNDDCSN